MAQQRRQRPTKTTQSVTTGTVVRIEPASSSRQKQPKVAVVVAQELNPVGGFVNFLREHAVVGLAVGFAIGAQAQVLVKSLVSSFITPLFTLLFGQNLQSRVFHLSWHGRSVPFGWGQFVYDLMDFIFVLAAIYFVIQIFNLDKLDKPKKKA